MKKVICILIILVVIFNGCFQNKTEMKPSNNIIETNINFYKAHVNHINFDMNYIEVQTWDFNIIVINFLNNSLSNSNEKINFNEGDSVVIINAKEDKYENGNIFYFADKDTIISRCSVTIDDEKKENKDIDKKEKPIINEVLEEKNDNYNYNNG